MTVKAFVIGHPINHSRSPLIHGTWLAEHGIDGSYEAIDVAPEALPAFFDRLRQGEFAGGNVTIPHKEAVFALCDSVDPLATTIGAVNTLVVREGRVHGTNTDYLGFLGNLDASAPGWSDGPNDALIIGADQVFVNPRGAMVGKPGGFEAARSQLAAMAGRKSLFYTGIAVYDRAENRSLTDFAVTAVTFRDLSDAEIRSYLLRERPYDCAGSFKIEGLGIALMEKVEGDDYTALVGLPLIRLNRMLMAMGVNALR